MFFTLDAFKQKKERIKEDGSENNEMCLHENGWGSIIFQIDIDDDGINELRNKIKFRAYRKCRDIDPSSIDPNLDLIVLSEVLEHMGNPMESTSTPQRMQIDATMVTVPNAFGLRNMIGMILARSERLDHYYYYSSVVSNSW